MKSVLLIALLLSLLAVAFSAVSYGFYRDSDHPGKCVIRPDLILSPGEHQDPDSECGRVFCGEDGSAEFQTCGVQMAPPDCSLGAALHPDANYPDCCEQEINC